MVVYDEANNRLEIVDIAGCRKRFIPCVGINPATEKVLGAEAFGDEVRLRVVPKAGSMVGTGVFRVVKYSVVFDSTENPGKAAEKPAPDPFASRNPRSRF
jgi:hypothetical protein